MYEMWNRKQILFLTKPIRTISGFWELISRFEFEFCRCEFFFEGFEFLVCSCERAVACLCPRNSISNVVVSLTIHDDMYKYMYICLCKRCLSTNMKPLWKVIDIYMCAFTYIFNQTHIHIHIHIYIYIYISN